MTMIRDHKTHVGGQLRLEPLALAVLLLELLPESLDLELSLLLGDEGHGSQPEAGEGGERAVTLVPRPGAGIRWFVSG